MKRFAYTLLLSGLWVMTILRGQGQDRLFTGVAPAVSFTDPLHRKLEWNGLAAAEVSVGERQGGYLKAPSAILQLYGQTLLSYVADSHWQLGAGFGFQRNEPFSAMWQSEYRAIQQVFFATRFSRLHLYSRLRTEERWFLSPQKMPQQGTRARGLLGLMQSSRGGGCYWNVYIETLAIPTGQRTAIIGENWLYAGLGLRYARERFIELGLGYDSVVIDSRGATSGLILLQATWIVIFHGPGMNTMGPVMRGKHF